jgi:uncharacterized tellurite resistance protein B-like protein
MLNSIKRFFEDRLAVEDTLTDSDRICRVQLASAALLLELMKTDRKISYEEETAFREILANTFDLDDAALQEISELAEEEIRQATSLYEFTSLVNDSYSYADKVKLIENMWRIAFADTVLDKYEEQMIRKTADLIYVSHSDFIRSKLSVRQSQSHSSQSSST